MVWEVNLCLMRIYDPVGASFQSTFELAIGVRNGEFDEPGRVRVSRQKV